MSRPFPEAPRGLFPGPRVSNLFRILLTALTVAVVLWYVRSRPALDFSGMTPRWDRLALACACLPFMLLLRCWKWRIILRAPSAGKATFGEAARSYLGSMALGLVTPGRVGEMSRGLYLPHPEVRGWRGAGLTALDSWTDFLSVLAWGCLGGGLLFGAPGAAAGAALLAVAAPVPAWLRLAASVTSRFPFPARLRAWLEAALPAPGDVPVPDLLKAAALGILAYGLEWVQMGLLLAFLLPDSPPLWQLAGVMALVALANTFQVTLAGLGVREGLAMLLLARHGVAPEPAVAAAFLQTALVFLLPALAGLAVRPAAGPGRGPGPPGSIP